MSAPTLYHFTPLGHIAHILADGFIKAHTDRERVDPYCWFTVSDKGEKDIKHQPFPLARITMKPDFDAMPFDREKHWEKIQTPQYIASMDLGKKLLGYVESDWWVHEGNVLTERIASIHMKRTRMTPWEELKMIILERRSDPDGTFFKINDFIFVMIDIGKDPKTRKQGWSLARVMDYATPHEKLALMFKTECFFWSDEQLKKMNAMKI